MATLTISFIWKWSWDSSRLPLSLSLSCTLTHPIYTRNTPTYPVVGLRLARLLGSMRASLISLMLCMVVVRSVSGDKVLVACMLCGLLLLPWLEGSGPGSWGLAEACAQLAPPLSVMVHHTTTFMHHGHYSHHRSSHWPQHQTFWPQSSLYFEDTCRRLFHVPYNA